jgi:Mrp family chromosome partitioning ATPase
MLVAQPARFSASAAVLVAPVPSAADDDPNGITTAPVNLGTEAQLVRSTDTARRAAALLGTTMAPAQLVEAVAVDPVADTSVLELRFVAPTADQAQAGARAFAQAYLAARADTADTALAQEKTALTTSLAAAQAQLADLDARIAQLPPDSPQQSTLRSARSTLTDQITTLTNRMSALTTTVVNPGQIIRDADRPSAPMTGPAWLYLGAGGAAGLLFGLGGAGLWERLRVRVRDADDVLRAGVGVLAELVHDDAELYTTSDPSGQDYHRLRNEVVAALTTGDRVLLLTAASPGPSSTVVAANLAAALARIGHEVILLGANAPAMGRTPVLLSGMFDISDVPGLTDVLSGRTDLGNALQVPPREPRLRVVTPGGAASASRLLQSATARAVVSNLRTLARYVLIDSPSAAAGADAQSLAGLADAAIVVAEAGHSRQVEVADAVAQLNQVGARVLGAVVLPPLPPGAQQTEGVVFLDAPPRPWGPLGEDRRPDTDPARTS